MEIKTPRLTLRPAGPVYLESTHAYASDPETTRLMMFLPVDSLEETLRFLENAAAEWAKPEPTYREFVILTDGEHVGGISLFGSRASRTARSWAGSSGRTAGGRASPVRPPRR